MPLKDILIFVIAFVVIVKSADFFTSGASGLAKALHIPRLVIGLTVVSLATSAPEFVVSVIASHMEAGGIAVGNVLGSCIANIGLALALAAIFRPIDFKPEFIKLELGFLIWLIPFTFLLMLNFRGSAGMFQEGYLGMLDGIILNLILVAAFIYIVRRELRRREIEINESNLPSSSGLGKDTLKCLLGGVGVVISAKYGLVPKGVDIARFLGVPEIVIGISMIAVGTSLPELFTALIAAHKRMGDLAAGTITGSNIINLLWVLGSSAMVHPLAIDSETLLVTMPVTLLFTVLVLIFARTGLRLVRWEGGVLLFAYIGYLVYLLKFAY